jgi:protein-tyrosine-phosphatase
MKTILFLCPHHAAKSILAEAYFNYRVKLEGLPFQADSAGTDPSELIWPTVIDLLAREGIALTPLHPRKVTRDDLLHTFQVISLGCALEEMEIAPQQFTAWEDVPLASVDLEGSWMAICRHVDQLLAALTRATEQASPEAAASARNRKTS